MGFWLKKRERRSLYSFPTWRLLSAVYSSFATACNIRRATSSQSCSSYQSWELHARLLPYSRETQRFSPSRSLRQRWEFAKCLRAWFAHFSSSSCRWNSQRLWSSSQQDQRSRPLRPWWYVRTTLRLMRNYPRKRLTPTLAVPERTQPVITFKNSNPIRCSSWSALSFLLAPLILIHLSRHSIWFTDKNQSWH